MPLDPQAIAIVEAVRAAPRFSNTPIAEARASYDSLRALGFGPADEVASIEELKIPGPGQSIAARLYRPAASNPGLFVHVHGGGFVGGSIDGYDLESRAFAARGRCAVLTFDYRLAPEWPFPAAVDDVCATLAWAGAHAAELGCDPGRIGIGGDSAGANLAAVCALLARDRGGPELAFQLLVYPNTDFRGGYASIDEWDSGVLSRLDIEWARDCYLTAPDDALDPRASPLLAKSHADLPPSLLVVAQCDVFRDEGIAYGERLREAGVDVAVKLAAGLPHGFFAMGAFVEPARAMVDETCAALRRALA